MWFRSECSLGISTAVSRFFSLVIRKLIKSRVYNLQMTRCSAWKTRKSFSSCTYFTLSTSSLEEENLIKDFVRDGRLHVSPFRPWMESQPFFLLRYNCFMQISSELFNLLLIGKAFCTILRLRHSLSELLRWSCTIKSTTKRSFSIDLSAWSKRKGNLFKGKAFTNWLCRSF